MDFKCSRICLENVTLLYLMYFPVTKLSAIGWSVFLMVLFSHLRLKIWPSILQSKTWLISHTLTTGGKIYFMILITYLCIGPSTTFYPFQEWTCSILWFATTRYHWCCTGHKGCFVLCYMNILLPCDMYILLPSTLLE